ncbi:MAG: hypothetical protein GC178_09685 [Flavobacteriales bacterium]|nr:hypothetical protein [Flavobacteriales bacterium]
MKISTSHLTVLHIGQIMFHKYIRAMIGLQQLSSRQQGFLALAVLFVINLISGIIAVTNTPIGLDEPFSIFHAQASVGEIIAELQKGNNPPLYEMVLHYWIDLFGIGQVSVRMPSLIFSILTVFGVFYLIRLIADVWNALSVAIMYSLCNYFIYISHEARAYALFWFLMVLSFNLVLRLMRSENLRPVSLVLALAVVNILMLYTHYFAIPIVLMQFAVISFMYGRPFARLKWLLLAFGVQFVGFIPSLSVFVGRFSDSASNGTWIKPVENLGHLHEVIFWFSNSQEWLYAILLALLYGAVFKWSLVELRSILFRTIVQVVILVLFVVGLSFFIPMPFIWHVTAWKPFTFIFIGLLALLVAMLFFLSYRKYPMRSLFLIMFVVPWLSMFAVSFVVPVFIDRYILFIAPFFFATLFVAVNYLFGKRTFYVQLLLIGGMLAATSPSFTFHPNLNSLMALVKENKQAETTVILNPAYFDVTFAYYYDQEIFKDYRDISERLRSKNIYSVYDANGLPEKMGNSVVLVDAYGSEFFPENGIREQLEDEYELEKEERLPSGMWVYVYHRINAQNLP